MIFYAVAVIGYGKSVPGANDEVRISEIQQASNLLQLINSRYSLHSNIVLVSRGWGVTVAIELAKVSPVL
jgi:hypothetical protein